MPNNYTLCHVHAGNKYFNPKRLIDEVDAEKV